MRNMARLIRMTREEIWLEVAMRVFARTKYTLDNPKDSALEAFHYADVFIEEFVRIAQKTVTKKSP
jgi:hypothetical protein